MSGKGSGSNGSGKIFRYYQRTGKQGIVGSGKCNCLHSGCDVGKGILQNAFAETCVPYAALSGFVFINPEDPGYAKPWFHEKDSNNLDVVTNKLLSRATLEAYFLEIEKKIKNYTENLEDDMLLLKPEGCKYTRFTLILAQHRHLHTHMGMIMGVITAETGLWPRVLGL